MSTPAAGTTTGTAASTSSMSRLTFAFALAIGLLVRGLVLPWPGTGDVDVWKIWSYAGATGGVTRMYGVGGDPPERRRLSYGPWQTTVDYPPMALYELTLTGLAFEALRPDYPDGRALTAAVKTLPLAADVALAGLIFPVVARLRGRAAAQWATLAYWLNPAIVLNGAVLGYLDPLVGLPVVAGFVAAGAGWPGLGAALVAVAVATKAQALIVVPVLAVAIVAAARGWRERVGSWLAAGLAGVATLAALVLPFALAGAWRNMWRALESLTRHDMLSGYATNLWWFITWITRSFYAMIEFDAWRSFTLPVKILAISTIVELGHPNPRSAALLIFAVVSGWMLWRLRRVTDFWVQCALGAFVVHAYFTLTVAVHENHLYLAVPLIVVAAAGQPRLRALAATLSAVAALNLFLFYGLGRGRNWPALRAYTVVDASVWLAVIDLVALAWFWRTLQALAVEATAKPARASGAGTPSAAGPRCA